MAGNAVGFGNFLRFPGEAAAHGGGAFMIPYVIALVFLGIPLMWVEWALGRFGGTKGHGTSPGMFELIWRSRWAKYVGLLGVVLPFLTVIFYAYVESWTLAYSFFSADGTFAHLTSPQEFGDFFDNLLGANGSYWPIYGFFVLTVLLNMVIMLRGISGGIEKFATFAMPTLFVLAIILVIRVLTLGAPLPDKCDQSVWNGLAFLWNPKFGELTDMSLWLAAAGQVFFTLSVGFGVIACYASYLRRDEDVVLSGLTTSAMNEFAEVVLGASLAIPLAFAFLGVDAVTEIAQQAFALAFVSMPNLFLQMPFGQVLSTLWFVLLFFAGVTSSIALAQTVVAFVEDEYGCSRTKAVVLIWVVVFACANLVIFGKGVTDELCFWVATVGIVVFALLELLVFVWLFGRKRAWDELNIGSDIRLPKAVYYIITYVTPLYLLGLLIAWSIQDGPRVAMMEGVSPEEVPWRWAARGLMVAVTAVAVVLIKWSRHLKADDVKDGGRAHE